MLAACGTPALDAVYTDVRLAAPASPPLLNGARHFALPDGGRITLSRGYLVTGSVELLACDSASAGLIDLLGAALLGRAHAHVEGSPTRLRAQVVESLLAKEGGSISTGLLGPPPGRWCTLRVGVRAAESDAARLPDDVPMVGRSLYVEGTFEAAGGGEPTAFVAFSSAAFDVDLPLDRPSLAREGEPGANVVVEKAADDWFAGATFEPPAAGPLARQVLENIRRSLRVSQP